MKIEKEIVNKVERYVIKVLRPFVVAGEVVKDGTFIEVSRSESVSLISRELAVMASPADMKAKPAILVAPAPQERELLPDSEGRAKWITGWRN